jgi:hypothetical protein
MPPSDEFDTIIQAVNAGYPAPGAGPVKPSSHPVLWFAAGTGLWVVDGILLYLFLWLLLHG